MRQPIKLFDAIINLAPNPSRRNGMIHVYGKQVSNVWFCVAFDNRKVFAVSFSSDEKTALQATLEKLPYGAVFTQLKKPEKFHDSVINVLSRIYMGKPVSQRFPLALERLPKRYQRILKTVGAIPCGYVATYGEVAKVCATGPRVVGRAMATNPFPLLIPCHRVVRSDLTLAGHGAGKEVRLSLLEKEKRNFRKEKTIRVDGKPLLLFPVERVLNRLERTNVKFAQIS